MAETLQVRGESLTHPGFNRGGPLAAGTGGASGPEAGGLPVSRPLGRLPRGPSEPLSGTQARASPPSTGSGPGRLQVSCLDKPVWTQGLQAGRGGGGRAEAGGAAGCGPGAPEDGCSQQETRGPQEGPGTRPLPDPQQSALLRPRCGLKHAPCSFRESKPPCACLQFSLKLLDCEDLVIRQSFLLYNVVLFRI